MSKKNVIEHLINYFNNYDFAHFVKIVSKIEVNYYKYLKCILKKDIFKISRDLLEDVKINDTKDEMIKTLGKHFSKHDYKYFLSKINNNIEGVIKYKTYLKCMSTKNINSIYDIINKHYMKQYVYDQLNLPFTAERKPRDLNYITKIVLEKSKNNIEDIIEYVSKLNKLFKGEIIQVGDMKIEIIKQLNGDWKSNDLSSLYYGKLLNGSVNGKKDVVIKSQPIFPDNIKEFKKYYDYQIPDEIYVMNKIKKFCYGSITSKIYGHEEIKALKEGDINRYILVTEKLGSDLDKITNNNYSVSFIKNICIKVLKALQTIHSCSLNEGISFVHRDIKPKNIVFTDETETSIKLIDFGYTVNILKNNKRDLGILNNGGTELYMSISQHEDNPVDYMDDFQAIAWMLLDFFGFDVNVLNDCYLFKNRFVNNYRNENFINKIRGGKLTNNNICVIGKLCEYTIKRADKQNRYSTDKQIGGVYYCDYNDLYYKDFENILNMLQ
jgi:serine/threonine protein kinase